MALPASALASPGRGPEQNGSDRQSQQGGGGGGGGFGDCLGRRGWDRSFGADFNSYRGSVVSVDATTGTITATVRQRGEEDQTVTFTTDEDTSFYRDGNDAGLADLRAGDKIEVLILVDEGTSLQDALKEAAFTVSAYSATSAYGFAGKVTALGDGTVSIRLRYATPAARTAMGSTTVKGTALTFAVNGNTRVVIRGGSSELAALGVLVLCLVPSAGEAASRTGLYDTFLISRATHGGIPNGPGAGGVISQDAGSPVPSPSSPTRRTSSGATTT